MQSRWYVIQTKSRQEFKACQELHKQGFKVFLPTIKVERVVSGRCTQKKEALFSRYLFIQLNHTDSNWGPLRSTRGVSGLVRFGAMIPSLSSDQLNTIKDWANNFPKQDCFLAGQLVQVISGPFGGMHGKFEKLPKATSGPERAIILFEILGKIHKISTPLADLR
jgi:transcriptional antiterminator RfaH